MHRSYRSLPMEAAYVLLDTKNEACMYRGSAWIYWQRLESSLTKNHEDHIAGKGYISMTHYNLIHKFIPMPQAMKFWDQNQQWTRNGRSWRQFQPGSWEKSDVRRRLFWKHKETKRKSTFLHWLAFVISRFRSKNQNYKNIEAESCSEDTL